jgi:hypothetical protein
MPTRGGKSETIENTKYEYRFLIVELIVYAPFQRAF